ncbi:MAG: hypothetical protein ACE5IB_06550 [Candidatus Geothermarchaeales archaeon]
MSTEERAVTVTDSAVNELLEVRKRSDSESTLGSAFPGKSEIRSCFHDIWARVEEHLDLSLTSDEALRLFPSLVVYDIPDGTRSTLTVRADIDVGIDAALYCTALIHTLKGLGAESCVIMTHTEYNRERGPEGLKRILRLLAQGVKPISTYSKEERIAINLVGMKEDYELRDYLLCNLPEVQGSAFNAFFLVDHAEERFQDPQALKDLEQLPEVDVCVRHTKLNLSGGGWIPGKLLKSTFMYCQNGTLFSNWTFDELVALDTLALVAKLLNAGEGLVKMYGDIDEVKARYQCRELRLFNKQIRLRNRPSKLFLLGSPHGIYQFYY